MSIAKLKNLFPIAKKYTAIGMRNNPIPKKGSASANEIRNAFPIGCSNWSSASPTLSKKKVITNN